MNISDFANEEFRNRGEGRERNQNWVHGQGERCLITLEQEILTKDLKQYKYFLGNTFIGLIVDYWSESIVRKTGVHIRIGNHNNPNRIIIPNKLILSIQPCEKILKMDNLLVIED